MHKKGESDCSHDLHVWLSLSRWATAPPPEIPRLNKLYLWGKSCFAGFVQMKLFLCEKQNNQQEWLQNPRLFIDIPESQSVCSFSQTQDVPGEICWRVNDAIRAACLCRQ